MKRVYDRYWGWRYKLGITQPIVRRHVTRHHILGVDA